MRFERLRLCGFKSFVEPVEIEIEDGLSGVVGPNGCGKSNLVEGLRWLMGANSAKAMRASGMDEVIFAGTSGGRPARSWAEVTLEIDNSSRKAPAQFNDQDTLTVSRRVIRRADGSVSVYTINGKEVRARDVQVLFADASTGATSPALVRQGQIAELINAKPTERRRFLEEAAGITGLAARRHEAQLRLKAAGDNLERLDDVIGELDVQAEQLGKQARKAAKYRILTEEIRETGDALLVSRIRASADQLTRLDRLTSERRDLVARATEAAASADRNLTARQQAVDAAREKERAAAKVLSEAEAAYKAFENEERLRQKAAEERKAALARAETDLTREGELLKEAAAAIETASAEARELKSAIAAEGDTQSELNREADAAEQFLQQKERQFEELQRRFASAEAETRAYDRAQESAARAVDQAMAQLQRVMEKIAALPAIDRDAADRAGAELEEIRRTRQEKEEALSEVETRREETRAAASEAESAHAAAKQKLALLEKEIAVLRPLIPQSSDEGASGDSLLAALSVPETLRAALAGALGQGLNAKLSGSDDHAWTSLGRENADLAPLPSGVTSLDELIDAPAELHRALRAIGLIEEQPTGTQLGELAPGQVLVNRQGHVWRWDGYLRKSEADAHLEELLAASFRLSTLEEERETAVAERADAEAAAAEARTEAGETAEAVKALRGEVDRLAQDERRLRRDAETLLREAENAAMRRETLDEQKALAEQTLAEAEARRDEAARDPRPEAIDRSEVEAAREARDQTRRTASQLRAQANEHARDATQRRDRLRQREQEEKAWAERKRSAAGRMNELGTLRERLIAEITESGDDEPDAERSQALELAAFDAKQAWQRTQDAVMEGEKARSEAEKQRRETEAKAASEREALAEIGAEFRAIRERYEDILDEADLTNEQAEHLLARADETDTVERLSLRLTKLERERERLGAVNLLAAEEGEQVTERLETLRRERQDCDDAAAQLRQAIGAINREGRQRLLAAFETVDRHFRELFVSLFGGGQAELRFVDNDDPLAAGVEIFASPPGKKLQSLSLMSGGEQALTATALIFAAFRTNPAPICVLDEVDAPLDDANVERFCNLLAIMAKSSTTRFLVVTHHPLTMSRMDRLYGVTMIERGVSRLFSIDLESARRLAA
jgi:chromosome segregation protein